MTSTADTFQTTGSLRSIWNTAYPIALSLAIPQIQQFVNTAFLGNHSTLDQSILGISSIVFMVFLSLSFGMSNGAMLIFSRFNGQKDARGLGESFNTMVYVALFLSTLLSLFYFTAGARILDSIIEDAQVSTGAQSVLSVLMLSFPVYTVLQLASSFFISLSKSILILYITLVGTAVHIFCDYSLIFGRWGLPELGVLGSAYASLIADFVMLFIGLWVLYSQGFAQRYNLRFDRLPEWARVVRQMRICLPLFLQYLITLSGWLIFFLCIESMGQIALASAQIVRSSLSISGVMSWALASVANSFTSNLLGQGKSDQARRTILRIATFSSATIMIFSCIFWFVPESFLTMMTDDPAVLAISIEPLRLIGFVIILMAFTSSVFNGIIGTGKVGVSIAIEIATVLIYLTVLYRIILPSDPDLTEMWSSEFVYWLSILIFSLLYLFSSRFRKIKNQDF